MRSGWALGFGGHGACSAGACGAGAVVRPWRAPRYAAGERRRQGNRRAAWEISNSDRDKRCPVTFSVDPAPGGASSSSSTPACDHRSAAQGRRGLDARAEGSSCGCVDAKNCRCSSSPRSRAGFTRASARARASISCRPRPRSRPRSATAEQLFGDWQIPARARQAALPADAL